MFLYQRIIMKVFKLSYKWVSWRSPKIKTHGFKQNKIEYIEFIKTYLNEGNVKIKIDEFKWIDLPYRRLLGYNNTSYII